MSKRRKKGSVEDISIADLFDPASVEDDETKAVLEQLRDAYEGCSVGIKHIGPGRAREWEFRFNAWRTAELKRKRELKRELEGDEAALALVVRPEYATEAGTVALYQVTREILEECVVRVKGFDELDSETDPKVLVQLLFDDGLETKVLDRAREVQSVRPAHSFRPSGAGDVEPERAGGPGQ